MPRYNMKCGACGTEAEYVLKHFNSVAKCRDCGSSKLEKLPGGFSIGSGQGSDSQQHQHSHGPKAVGEVKFYNGQKGIVYLPPQIPFRGDPGLN